MDDLLKEAIADAKAVRETALANAKAVIEEAFAPKLQSMLSATLQNEADSVDSSDEDNVTVENEDFGNKNDEFNSLVADNADNSEVVAPEASEAPEEERLEEDEFSLDSIVKELEEEANSIEPDVNAPIEDEAVAAEPSKAEEENEIEEEVNLEELINELKAEYSEASKSQSDVANFESELSEVKKSLEEHRGVIKFLREKLNEVNLLNAKLLFTNKLFKKHSMNESQKLKVIETLDRATNLKECKLVYSTLEETFDGVKSAVKKAPAQKIVESIASKPIQSTKPSEETVKAVINEGADLAARFKKLAGIK